jgi:hypothetical protein
MSTPVTVSVSAGSTPRSDLELPTTAPLLCVDLLPHQQTLCLSRFFKFSKHKKSQGAIFGEQGGYRTCTTPCLANF